MAKTLRISVWDFPRLTKFYGIGPIELASVPYNILRIYAEEMPVLAAEELQGRILASDMPYADKEDRRRVFDSLRRLSAEEVQAEAVDVRTEEGQAKAASFGIKVEVPVKDDAVESE